MPRLLVVILTYDDPSCGGAADALVDQLQKEASEAVDPEMCRISVKALTVAEGGSHRDVLYGALQDFFQVHPEDIFVISLLKGHQPDDYRKIRDLCSGVKPHALRNEVITHLANYEDVSLVIRNLVRLVLVEMANNAGNKAARP